MSYSRTQKGHLDTLLFSIMLVVLGIALLLHGQPIVFYMLVLLAGVLFAFALAFGRLTVRDGGDDLVLSYGPLPVFGKRIPFASITDAHKSQSRLIDGWGIHYIPGRGWTYNLWGFDCVALRVGKRLIRVGTDDPDNLVAAIRNRIGDSDHSDQSVLA